ncbi:MAG: hypothetical protein H6736_01410 [Alphaproteobacteria bacterium]|nr:hypothetical protein [Alphaproteobacteria bacterium]MCB9690448.1 hypothetical protein [Alphaproteobacteria bacterium]
MWALDLAAAGALGASLAQVGATLVWLITGMHFVSVPWVSLVAVPALVAAPIGAIAGLVAHHLLVVRELRPLTIAPLGFVFGTLGGGLAGWLNVLGFATPRIARELLPDAAIMSAICGGLFLGALWLPWTAVRASGRSGLPLALLASIAAPVVAVVVLLGTAALLSL